MKKKEKQTLNLLVDIHPGMDLEPDRLDTLTRGLRGELVELGVESADLVAAGNIPEGVKSADPVTLGVLAVAVLPSFLEKLVEYLQAWCMRAENRKVRIKTQVGDRSVEVEYSPSAISEDELTQLVSALSERLNSTQGSPAE